MSSNVRGRFFARAVTLLLFASFGLVFAEPLFAKQKLSLALTGKSRAEVDKSFAGIIAHLQSSSLFEFEIVQYTTYEESYAALKSKNVDLVVIGAVKYVEAHHEIGAVPIVAEGGAVRSMIIVRKDSPLKSAKELKGKSFAFGYDGSTSTHLIPLLLMSKNLVKQADLRSTQFVGADQEKIVAMVLAGEVDAGGIVENMFDRYKGKVRALETSDPFPGGPLVARKDMPATTIEALRKLFTSYKPVAGERFGKGASSVKDSDFNQVRFLCKVVLGKSYI
ncbi:MAG: PhnD/SsuA/transferrin family substrate-binding protein [Acidobacteria bacterium]|nr:PhnD/SsuA/transferrin family substrate-binding protein [Acidobacteriota bacterium]